MSKKEIRFDQSGYFPSQPKPTRPSGTRTGAPTSAKRVRRGLSGPARLGLIGLCAAVFVFSAVQLIRYFSDLDRVRRQNEELSMAYYATTDAPLPEAVATAEATTMIVAETPQPAASAETPASSPTVSAALTPDPFGRTRLTAYPNNPNLIIADRFVTLRKRNKDISAWLTIDGVLDQAVVQRDNSYYLGRDYLGYHNAAGALFIDENCALEQVPEQIVIHGHNMKTGDMFGILKKYKTSGAEFYRAHPYVRLSTLYEDATYIIFAVAEVDTRPEQGRYLGFLSYAFFTIDEDFTQYVSRAKMLSYYECPVDVQPSDRLLTLATCTGTDDNTRLLVMARQLRPDEDKVKLEAAILSTHQR